MDQDGFPCESQHFMFLLSKDFAADIINHVIFFAGQGGEITGCWVKKQAKVSVYNRFKSTVMPRKSKSAISRIQNLESSAKKRSQVTVTIEVLKMEGELPYSKGLGGSFSGSRRSPNRSARFISAYDIGLSGDRCRLCRLTGRGSLGQLLVG